MVLLCLNKSPTINYSLKSIVLHLQLCSTRYTALCKKLLCLNPAVQTKRTRAPMINYTLKSKVNITLYLLLYSACYTALLTNNCVKNLNPCCFRKKPLGSHFLLLQINTSEKSWNKGGQMQHHDAYYVAAVVGKRHASGQSNVEQ